MKKVLICTEGLPLGGLENALINFLKHYSKRPDLDITLLMQRKVGENLKNVPSNVKIITIPFKREFYNAFEVESNIHGTFNKILHKFYKALNILMYRFTKKFSKTYTFFLKKTKELDEHYDIAIDFHGVGYFATTYLVEKVKAKYRIMWVHTSDMEWTDYVTDYLDSYDKYYCVSNYNKKLLEEKCSNLKNKTAVSRNIIDYDKIASMSNEYVVSYDKNTFNILTVGRLSEEKGYEIIIDTAKILKDNNINFKWYIIGDGILKDDILNQIKNRELENYISLLGSMENPYPYFKDCSIYVQSSRIEGYGITISEAKYFKRPIVCSNIPTFEEQIEDNKNGFLCELLPNSFAKKIIDIYNNYDKVINSIENIAEEEQMNIQDIM